MPSRRGVCGGLHAPGAVSTAAPPPYVRCERAHDIRAGPTPPMRAAAVHLDVMCLRYDRGALCVVSSREPTLTADRFRPRAESDLCPILEPTLTVNPFGPCAIPGRNAVGGVFFASALVPLRPHKRCGGGTRKHLSDQNRKKTETFVISDPPQKGGHLLTTLPSKKGCQVAARGGGSGFYPESAVPHITAHQAVRPIPQRIDPQCPIVTGWYMSTAPCLGSVVSCRRTRSRTLRGLSNGELRRRRRPCEGRRGWS